MKHFSLRYTLSTYRLDRLHLAEGTQYRLVGPGVADYPSAQPTRPGLEDDYVWLMKSAGQTVEMV